MHRFTLYAGKYERVKNMFFKMFPLFLKQFLWYVHSLESSHRESMTIRPNRLIETIRSNGHIKVVGKVHTERLHNSLVRKMKQCLYYACHITLVFVCVLFLQWELK